MTCPTCDLLFWLTKLYYVCTTNPFAERLTLDQNKQLCKAAKLRHGGPKKDLIDRLLDDDFTSQFGPEGNFFSLNVDQIKQLCRARNLQVSGQKFDLVLRILHCDNDSTPEGTTLKRAATETVSELDAATGQVVEKHVPKKRKKAAPSASRAYTRVQKKIESVKQKKYQSHWGSKTHSSDVYGLVATLLTDEALPNLTKDPRLSLDIAKAAITSLTDNFHTMQRPGYDDLGGLGTIDNSLCTIAEKVKPLLSEEEKEEFANWIEEWDSIGEPYGLTMDTDLLKTAAFIRGEDDGKKSEGEEVDERKPAAMPTKADEDEKVKSHGENLIKENVKNEETTA
eukprot:scaffold799_cov107-Skeletonema_marinoi.AAC.4